MTEVFIPMPDINKVSGMQVELDAVEFSSTSEVVYHHDGVGSGRASYKTINGSAGIKMMFFSFFSFNTCL